jgi:hypothetical protein
MLDVILYSLGLLVIALPLVYLLATRRKREAKIQSKFPPFGINLIQLDDRNKRHQVEHIPVDFEPILIKTQKSPEDFPLVSSIDGYGATLFTAEQYPKLLAELAKLSLDDAEQKACATLSGLKDRVQAEKLAIEFVSVLEH